jgi:hypothetical protein
MKSTSIRLFKAHCNHFSTLSVSMAKDPYLLIGLLKRETKRNPDPWSGSQYNYLIKYKLKLIRQALAHRLFVASVSLMRSRDV